MTVRLASASYSEGLEELRFLRRTLPRDGMERFARVFGYGCPRVERYPIWVEPGISFHFPGVRLRDSAGAGQCVQVHTKPQITRQVKLHKLIWRVTGCGEKKLVGHGSGIVMHQGFWLGSGALVVTGHWDCHEAGVVRVRPRHGPEPVEIVYWNHKQSSSAFLLVCMHTCLAIQTMSNSWLRILGFNTSYLCAYKSVLVKRFLVWRVQYSQASARYNSLLAYEKCCKSPAHQISYMSKYY